MKDCFDGLFSWNLFFLHQNGSANRKSVDEQIDVIVPVDESTSKKRVAYEKAAKLRFDSKKPVVGTDHKRNAMHVSCVILFKLKRLSNC